jgi:hypothetical protein
MDWQLAIDKNLEALKRTLAMLVGMVAVADRGSPKGDDSASGYAADDNSGVGSAGNGRAGSEPVDVDAGGQALAEKSEPSRTLKLPLAHTLPRHLHRFILRMLRPTEAATRRLIFIAARGLMVKIRPFQPRKPGPKKPPLNRKNGYGTGIVIRPGPLPGWARELMPRRAPALSLPLLDSLPGYGVRRRNARPTVAPRVRLLGGDPINPLFRRPEPLPPPLPTPDDQLDATRICYRLEAIGRALDDLPGQAARMARWAARRDARLARQRGETDEAASQAADLPPRGGDPHLLPRSSAIRMSGMAPPASIHHTKRTRYNRLSPMRPGRPPGFRKRSNHEIHAVLNELHGLAVWARSSPDTS